MNCSPTSTINNIYFIGHIPSSFSGKERDAETGFGYFGARYYDAELTTTWLSVDPMADKYPSISPYAYCAWNPVKLVDPEGEEVYVLGLQSEGVISLLQTAKMKIVRDDNSGRLNVSFRGNFQIDDLSDEERMIYDAINSAEITINVRAESALTQFGYEGDSYNAYSVRSRDGNLYETFGGVFDGSEYIEGDGGHANTYCIINLELKDVYKNDQLVPHEISEQFLLGQITLEKKCGIATARLDEITPEYLLCHNKAIPQKSNYNFSIGGLYLDWSNLFHPQKSSIWGD